MTLPEKRYKAVLNILNYAWTTKDENYDTSFICADGKIVRAHKFIISINTAFLKTMINKSAHYDSSTTIHVPHVSREDLETSLNKLYNFCDAADFDKYLDIYDRSIKTELKNVTIVKAKEYESEEEEEFNAEEEEEDEEEEEEEEDMDDIMDEDNGDMDDDIMDEGLQYDDSPNDQPEPKYDVNRFRLKLKPMPPAPPPPVLTTPNSRACKLCSHVSESMDELLVHSYNVHTYKYYKCLYCTTNVKLFRSKADILHHYKEARCNSNFSEMHYKKKPPTKYKCGFPGCSQSLLAFNDTTEAAGHVDYTHPRNNEQRCPLCYEKHESVEQYNEHVLNSHFSTFIQCMVPSCSFTTHDDPAKMFDHLLEVHLGFTVTCPYCSSVSFRTRPKFDEHVKECIENKYATIKVVKGKVMRFRDEKKESQPQETTCHACGKFYPTLKPI